MRHFLLEGATRHLPAAPLFYGIFTFAVLALFLYLVLRLDQD
jgi:hypothetical protein